MQDAVTAAVARRIRRLRHEAGLTIEALADLAKMPPETLARIERGATTPTIRTIGRIATGLGTEPVALFWRDDGTPTRTATIPQHIQPVVELLAGVSVEDGRWAHDLLVTAMRRGRVG